MKKYIVLLGFSVFLVVGGCSQKDSNFVKEEFIIETKELSGFTNQIVIEKSTTLESDQNIRVSAQANGRVGKILVKEGDTVKAGQKIIQLDDNVAHYGVALKRAKAAVNAAQLQYQNAKVGLNKNISDSQLNIKKTETLLDAVTSAGIQRVKNAKQNVNSADTRLLSLKSQFSSEKDKLENLFQTVVEFGDKLLGFSIENQNLSQEYQHLISAKDSNKKVLAKQQLAELLTIKQNISQLPENNLDNAVLLNNLIVIQGAYNKISGFLIQLVDVMNATVDGASLPLSQINGFIATINKQKSTNHQLIASFNMYKSQIEGILSDSSNPTKNTLKSSATIGLETAKIQTKKNLKDAQLALENANNTYSTALKSRDTQLSLLANAITQAQIAYENVSLQYAKLTITSPIDGVVGSIGVDKGQEIMMGTPVFSVSNKNEQILEIQVSSNEYGYLKIGQVSNISYENKVYTGKVSSISSVATNNGLYKVGISTQSDIPLLGGVAKITIPVSVDGFWLPVNMVTIVGDNIGYVWSYDNNKLVKHTVNLGEMWGDNIKILNNFTGKNLIISNLENYEPVKYSLVTKKL